MKRPPFSLFLGKILSFLTDFDFNLLNSLRVKIGSGTVVGLVVLLVALASIVMGQPVKHSLPSNTNTVQVDLPPPPPNNPGDYVAPIPGVLWLMAAGLGLGVRRMVRGKGGAPGISNEISKY